LACIAHTLQLVIKDALDDVSSVDRAIEAVARLIASTNKSHLLKEKIENLDKCFVKRNDTRWSSQFNMIKSFLNFSEDELEQIFDRKNVINQTQRSILNELIIVLEDFAVITDMIQTDKFSIGHILPLIRGLKKELAKLQKLKHCEKIKNNLISSLEKRFGYLENSPVYAFAAIFTPKYGKRWLADNEKDKWDDEIILQVEDFRKRFGTEHVSDLSTQELKEPVAKRVKVLSYLEFTNKTVETQQDLSTAKFWKNYEKSLPDLAAIAKFILTVPATSAPVERIFSVGSSILRPSRRCLKDEIFQMLIFLKCNLNLFKN
ncbi:unnamed protein product, partial [Brachionus calyciflorus]